MNKQILKFFSLAAIMLICLNVSATKRYWLGTGATKNWNATDNWSATSGGASGASVPVSTDSVYFDGNGDSICSINAAVNIRYLNISAGYTRTINQNANTVVVGTSGMVMSGGTFSGGSSNITNSGIFTLSGTNFTSTSATLSISGNYNFTSGTFTHNNGTVIYTGTISVTGSTNYYNMSLPASSVITFDVSSTFNISNLLTQSGGALTQIVGGTLNVQGDVTQTNFYAAGGGSGTINFNGTGTQYFNGHTSSANYTLGWLCNIKINKSAGTLYLKDYIVIQGKWEYVAGIVDVTTNSSTVSFPSASGGVSNIILGTQTLNSIITTTYGGNTNILTVNSGDTLTLNGAITTYGTGVTGFAGIINLKGDITVNNTSNVATTTGGTGIINIVGTGSQTITGASAIGQGRLCNIKINKSSGTLILKNVVSVGGNWIYTQGSIDASTYTSTVCFSYSTGRTISGNHSLYNVSFYAPSAGSTSTITASDTLSVLGTMTIDGTQWNIINSGTINLKGHLTINNTHTSASGGGTATINISGTTEQTLTGALTSLAGRLPSLKINKPSGTLVLKNFVCVAGNWQYLQGIIEARIYSSTVVFPFNTARSISGKYTLFNVTFYGDNTCTNTISQADTITVVGGLKFEGISPITINTGVINAKDHITITNTYTSVGGGTGYINICGTANQTLTGSGISIGGLLCNVYVNKPSGTLTLASIISCGQTSTWKYVQGTVDPGSSSNSFIGGGTINCGTASSSMSFNNLRIHGGTVAVTLLGVLNVRGNLTIDPARSLTSNSHNVTIGGNWINNNIFNYGTSTVTFNGSGNQYISRPQGGTENFYAIVINKPSGKMYLNNGAMGIVNSIGFTKGIIATTAVKFINLNDNATISGGSDSSYVCGPMKKTGNDAFTFPLGDTTLSGPYHPLAITAPSVSTDAYTAQYFPTNQTYGSTIQTDSLDAISNCEYWVLTRNAGSSTVIPTLGWNTNSCNIYGVYDLAVVGWNGSQWNTLGKSATTFGTGTGTVSALIGLSLTTLPIAIGNPKSKKSTSECVLKKKLDAGYYTLYNGFLKFKFDEEYVNNGSELQFKIYDKNRAVVVSDASVGATLNVVNKDNRWGINVKAINPSLPTGYYVLEVKDRKGEISMLRFKL